MSDGGVVDMAPSLIDGTTEAPSLTFEAPSLTFEAPPVEVDAPMIAVVTEATPAEVSAATAAAATAAAAPAEDVVESSQVRSHTRGSVSSEMCNICLEDWSNTGEHRVASLRCGHLFGHSCIEEWLGEKGGRKCPQCNEAAETREIRDICCKRLKVIDTACLEEEKKRRRQAEATVADLRVKLEENERKKLDALERWSVVVEKQEANLAAMISRLQNMTIGE